MSSVRPLEVAGVQLKVPLNTKRARREAATAIADYHRSKAVLDRNRLEGDRLRDATRLARITKSRIGDAVKHAKDFLAQYDEYAAGDAVAFVPKAETLSNLRKSLA